MKAVTYTRYGGPDVLHLADVPAPAPGDRAVLIRVRAAEATKSDCELRSFRLSVKWTWLPLRIAVGVLRPRRHILGMYFAGEVVSPKPRNMTYAEAAAVPLGGLNALHFMRRAAIKPGEQVLINGAGGSIGAHAVQLAHKMGAQVTAVDHRTKEDLVRRLGADDFVDYTTADVTTTAQRFDVIFDMVAGSPYRRLIGMLQPGGRYLHGNPRLSVLLRSVLTKNVTVAFAPETSEALATLTEMTEAGEIQPIVDRVYPMAEAADAHRRVETEQRLGAVVITLDHQG
ncbi:NAD(P)-dependent alcohol dehydrogenase [Actinoplanes sp. NPDC049596]|uniref:NAD(P)-dependent alcohol dehydrogenase n=1 Tax=unclassified Actinoplanes TaxID=2626549 RepID=UPI003434EC0F